MIFILLMGIVASYETLFVFEMIRHGARSHEFGHLMHSVPADFFGIDN